nr:hypothetical protein [Nitrosomonas aestuarii]
MHHSSHTPFDEICRVKESQSFMAALRPVYKAQTRDGLNALDALEAK